MDKKFPIRKEVLEVLENPEWHDVARKTIDSIIFDKKDLDIPDIKTILKYIYIIVLNECADIRAVQTTHDNRIIELEHPGLPYIK